MSWKQIKNFNPASMGTKSGWCLQNTRLGFGIGSGSLPSAKADMQNNRNKGTLHPMSEYDNSISVPVYIDSTNVYEHIGCLHHGVYYSDGRVATLPTARVFGWGEICDGVRVVEKVVPQPQSKPVQHYIGYTAHCEDIGWQSEVFDGATAGTTNQSRRMEAFKLRTICGGTVEFVKLHLQDIGWQTYNAPSADTICGTVGQSRRIEDICIKLSGFKFRVHIQDTGWTPWTACDGISTLGTVGQSLRIEAIQISK